MIIFKHIYSEKITRL